MGSGRKTQRIVDVKEAAALLRAIAAGLEGESAGTGDIVLPPVEDLRKLSVSIKKDRDAESVSFKLKVKEIDKRIVGAPSAGVGGEIAVPKKSGYKSLKKDMKGTFRDLSKSLNQGVLPSAATVETFVQQGIQMCEYPGKGDEHYEEFRLRCRELKEAFENGDLAGCRAAQRELQRMRIECHSDHR